MEYPILLKKDRDLAHGFLSASMRRLFSEITGLPIILIWSRPRPSSWRRGARPEDYPVACRLMNGSARLSCGPCRVALTLDAGGRGHAFTCPLGVWNFWLPIRAGGTIAGIAAIRALRGRRGLPRPSCATATLNAADSSLAARLLRLVLHYVEIEGSAREMEDELAMARQCLVEHSNEEARLRQRLRRIMPEARERPASTGVGTHARQLVEVMLNRLHTDFDKPITLKACAAQLGRNPAYLCDLFSHIVGLSFKAYLTELRLEKAQVLLSIPAESVKEVARAVGYASASSFLAAFKKATGLSPSKWRDMLSA